jgi:hypothetical protein
MTVVTSKTYCHNIHYACVAPRSPVLSERWMPSWVRYVKLISLVEELLSDQDVDEYEGPAVITITKGMHVSF